MTTEAATDRLPAGSMFGRYIVVRHIGSGGMGDVYEARHVDLDKRVALKTLRIAHGLNEEIVRRFQREGRAASRIRHPNVVDVSDVGVADGVPFLVMEYLEGVDLGARIASLRSAPVEQTVDIMLPVVAALAAAHDEQIVHRDMKPENIFLARTRDGHEVPKVLDFGISKVVEPPGTLALTNTGAILGTPYYMSPEQAQKSNSVDARSDQYSVGVILYECATGKRPFEGETLFELIHALVIGDLAPPRQLRPDLPEGFDAVIVRAMARVPADRFPSMRALGAALLPFARPSLRTSFDRAFKADHAPVPDAGSAEKPPDDSTSPSGDAETLAAPSIAFLEGAHASRPAWMWVGVGAIALAGIAISAVTLGHRGSSAHSRPAASISVQEPVVVPPNPALSLDAGVPITTLNHVPPAAVDAGIVAVAPPLVTTPVPTIARETTPRARHVEATRPPPVAAAAAAPPTAPAPPPTPTLVPAAPARPNSHYTVE